MSSEPTSAPTPDAYADAVTELESLLSELEGSDVDVDVLVERVARGAELIRFCRQRLNAVDANITGLVTELLDRSDEADNPAPDGAG